MAVLPERRPSLHTKAAPLEDPTHAPDAASPTGASGEEGHTSSGAILELESLAGFELRRAHAASARKFTEIFSDLKIKPGQFSILLAVSRFPDQSQAAIAKLLSLDPSSVVPLIDQLERKGFLKRVPKDRRSHAIRITDEGAEKLASGHEKVIQHETVLLTGLDRKERDTFLRLLKRVRANLEG